METTKLQELKEKMRIMSESGTFHTIHRSEARMFLGLIEALEDCAKEIKCLDRGRNETLIRTEQLLNR